MKVRKPSPVVRGVSLALLAGAIGGLATLPEAHAAVACRADPVVMLSNGVNVQMAIGIVGPATNVATVTYTLHVPIGTTVMGITYAADNSPGITEIVSTIADQKAGRYALMDVVQEQTSGYGKQLTHATVSATNTATGVSAKDSGVGFPGTTINMALSLS